jgi:capsule polysaccharide export protein KpsE/RkpR
LSTYEEHDQIAARSSATRLDISISELVGAVWNRRWWLAKVAGVGAIVALGIALLIHNQYTSRAQLMPPDSQSLSNISMLSALAGGSGAIAPSLTGGFLSSRTPGATFIGILNSETAQDDLIDRFDLRSVYHCKLYVDARAALSEATSIDEDKKSGIITISVNDRDKYRARDLTKAYVEELDKLVNKNSTSSAGRERVFLEERIKSVKSDLDTSTRALSNFSSRNATFDPQKQGEATVEAAGRLQGELILAQSELSGMKAEYTDDNMRVRAVQARVSELQRQLREMGGVGADANGNVANSDQLLPSVRQLPLLGVTYYDLYRQVTVQEAVYATLTKQYELAKVEEAKEIPPVKVLDEANVPERKSSPHRSLIVLLGAVIAALAGTTWIISGKLWNLIRSSYPAKTA